MAQIKELTNEAKNLKIFRKAEGLQQEAFCAPLTINRSILSRYETGFLNIPIDFVFMKFIICLISGFSLEEAIKNISKKKED